MRATLIMTIIGALALAGCNLDVDEFLDELENIEILIGDSVDVIQRDDPRTVQLPDAFIDRGDSVVINTLVDVIVDVSTELIYEELPNVTLIGFENLTGYDVYMTYLVDGEFQGVFVYDGETLLLEYPCVDIIEMLTEEDFDPIFGDFVREFDISDTYYTNPFDFECGDALIVTIDPVSLVANAERLDLY